MVTLRLERGTPGWKISTLTVWVKNFDISFLTKTSEYKIKTNPYEFPISVNQLDSNEACETLGALRSIFSSRMIFGTAEADKPDGVWQKQKFKEKIKNISSFLDQFGFYLPRCRMVYVKNIVCKIDF